MTSEALGEAYLWKAEKRLRVLDVLMEERSYIDFIPTEAYSEQDALRAREDARFVVEVAKRAKAAMAGTARAQQEPPESTRSLPDESFAGTCEPSDGA